MKIGRLRLFRLRLLGATLLAGAVVSGWACPAMAKDELRLSLSETGEWDSNPMMLTQGVEEVYGALTSGKVGALQGV